MRITESRLRRMIRQVILESSKHSFVEKFYRAYERRIPRLSDNFKIKAFLERLFVRVSKVNGRDVVDMLERMARSNSSNAIHQAIVAGTSGLSEPSNEKEYALHNFICALQALNDEGRVHARQNERDRNASLAGLLKNPEIVSLMGGEEKVKAMFDKSAEEINSNFGEDDLIIIGGAMSGQAITKLLCSIEGELYIVEPKGSIVDFYPEKRRGFDPTLDNYDVNQHGMLYDPDTNTSHTHADGTPVKYF